MEFETAKRVPFKQLENGYKSPTVDMLFRICPVLGVADSDFIVDGEQSLQTRRTSLGGDPFRASTVAKSSR